MHKSGEGTIYAHTTVYNAPQDCQGDNFYAIDTVKLEKETMVIA